MGWSKLLILLVIAAALCAVGFYKYVYFLSIGYGFAIAGLGISLMVMFHGQMRVVHFIQCLLFVIYGVRLSGFLLIRELKNVRYRQTLQDVTGNERTMTIGVKAAIWIGVAVLYVIQVSPVFYRQYNAATDVVLPWIGILISVVALGIESLADYQKSAQKAKTPDMVAMAGLYKVVRCPNYFGEILFWTGVTIGGFSALRGFGQWFVAILAYICIVGVMFNGAQRLEKRQMERYGTRNKYRKYAERTPIILPYVPIYHLNKVAKPASSSPKKRNRMNVGNRENEFTVAMALVDFIPVVLFFIGGMIIFRKVGNPLILVGVLLSTFGGGCKAGWKLILALQGQDITIMPKLFRICLPAGFLLIILSIPFAIGKWGTFLTGIFRMPALIFVLLGAACMVGMLTFIGKLNGLRAKSAWIEQTTNIMLQLCFLLAILLA